MLPALLILAAYLIGSISSAVIVSRLMGLGDPRNDGSGNPGATNVLRLGGRLPAAITLLGDMLKGVVPVALATHLTGAGAITAVCALAAFLGHLFPIFFQFRGGKGVATALGSVTALAWPVGLCMGGAWLLVALISRYSSLASLVAATGAPLITWLLGYPASYVASIALMSGLLVFRHKANIARLCSGTESKIGSKRPS